MKMNKLAVVLLGLCAVCQILHGAEQVSDADESARLLATEACSVCHGPGGNSVLPAIPSLAAQPRLYLLAKIKLFRNKWIDEPNDHSQMLGLTLIDETTSDALARYFARQPPPTPVPGDDALIAAGNRIFVHGDPDRGVAACSACHGANAHGIGIFPRLAGQHAEYVQRQLVLIQARSRDARVMHGIIKDMTSEEIKAVAAYVQSM